MSDDGWQLLPNSFIEMKRISALVVMLSAVGCNAMCVNLLDVFCPFMMLGHSFTTFTSNLLLAFGIKITHFDIVDDFHN